MTSEQRLVKAKVSLLISQPWFGQLSCYLNLFPKKNINTAGINERGDLFYNPKFIEKLSDLELKGLVCHEILHLAYQHPFRLQTRDPVLFNIAADLKVNQELQHVSSSLALPKGGLQVDYNSWKCANVKIEDIDKKTTEQIYYELKKQAFKIPSFIMDLLKGRENGKIDKKTGKVSSSGISGVPAKDLPALSREWKSRVDMVNQQQKGDIPAGLQRELVSLEYPELPWIQIIRQRLKAMEKMRSWKKYNKRYLPLYYAGTVKNKGLTAAIAIDTSGSISQQQLSKALSEIWGLAQTFRSIKLYLMTCDAAVWDTFELKNGSKSLLQKIKMRGGGGTDFRPVFNLVKKKFINKIDCLIFFTDGHGDFPSKKPFYPVYWITDSRDVKFPFGKVVYLKGEL